MSVRPESPQHTQATRRWGQAAYRLLRQRGNVRPVHALAALLGLPRRRAGVDRKGAHGRVRRRGACLARQRVGLWYRPRRSLRRRVWGGARSGLRGGCRLWLWRGRRPGLCALRFGQHGFQVVDAAAEDLWRAGAASAPRDCGAGRLHGGYLAVAEGGDLEVIKVVRLQLQQQLACASA